jgi:hypothetical protein
VERFGAAPEYVFSLIERHQIRCEPARNGTIHAAHAPGALKGLARAPRRMARLGAPVEMLGAEEARAMIGGGPSPAGFTTSARARCTRWAMCAGWRARRLAPVRGSRRACVPPG